MPGGSGIQGDKVLKGRLTVNSTVDVSNTATSSLRLTQVETATIPFITKSLGAPVR
jgi:hypothetical protein